MPEKSEKKHDNSTDETLENITWKQLLKLKEERNGLKIVEGKQLEKEVKEVIKNLDAYIKDTSYFLEKKDFIRAFEAVIYGWGIYETCRHLGLVQ